MISSVAAITSFREFTRNTAWRKKAILEKKPIIVQDKKEKEVFCLVPQEMYEGLWELYEDWKDSQTLNAEIDSQNKEETGKDWKTLKSEILS